MKNLFLLLGVFLISALLMSCNKVSSEDSKKSNIDTTINKESEINTTISKEANTNTAITRDEGKLMTNSDKPEVKVIYDYAKAITNKKYSEAFDKLGTSFKYSLSGPEDIHLKNIESMEIQELVDKTDIRENGKWNINPRTLGDNVYSYKVYYAIVNYKINHIAESYLKDGANYHKIITIKETKDSDWKIGEISGISK